MIKNSLGRIGIVFKGNYNSQTEYTPMDVVFYDGSSYICTNPTRDNLPTDNNYWNILVKSVSEEVVNSLENRIIDLESELPDKEEEGSNINITDSAQARASIVPLGNTEQYTVTDNLFDNVWENGDIHYDTGALLTSDALIRNKNYQKVVPNILYKLSRLITTGYMYFRFYDKDFNYLGSQSTEGFVTTNKADNRMYIGEASMELTISNANIAYMKCIDSSNNTSQIYTLITEVTPSILYPSPIKVVEGSFESYNICNAPYTKDNKLTITATKDDYYEFPDYYAEMEAGKTYTLSFESDGTYGLNSGTDTIQVFWLLNKEYTTQYQMNGFKNTFTPTVSGKYYLRCDVNKNGTTHGFWNFMVYEGKEDKPYLPYGTIKNTYETKIQNKNLLLNELQTQTKGGITATVFKDGSINFKGTSTSSVTFEIMSKRKNFLKNDVRYTLSSKNDIPTNVYLRLCDGENTSLYYELSKSSTPNKNTFVNSKIGDYIRSFVYFGTAQIGSSFDFTIYPMLEENNTATAYVEHQEQIKNLDFPEGIQLAKDDELEFSYTEKNGYKTIDRDIVYHVGNSNEYVFTGNEFVQTTHLSNGDILHRTKNFEGGKGNSLVYSNYFKGIENSTGRTNQTVYYNATISTFDFIENSFADMSSINEWVTQKYNEGNPLKVRYPLATPIKTQITDETFISQLEDLLNSETYKGVTNITTSKGSTEVADLIVKVDYKQSNNARIDALEKAILSLGSNV